MSNIGVTVPKYQFSLQKEILFWLVAPITFLSSLLLAFLVYIYLELLTIK